MSQYAVLQAWESFKSAALSSGLPITEALPRFALEKWAEAAADRPGSPGRAMREAVTASIVGAALTDIAIDKLAAEGAYTEPEREYLRQLNAEAALGDLGFLFKSALSLDPFRNHPKLTGGVVGGMLGAGFGAWKDEDNRVRGALAYGVPGAAIGALGGHLYEGHKERLKDLARQEADSAQEKALLAQRQEYQRMGALEEEGELHRGWSRLNDAIEAVGGHPNFRGSTAIVEADKLFQKHHDSITESLLTTGQLPHAFYQDVKTHPNREDVEPAVHAVLTEMARSRHLP